MPSIGPTLPPHLTKRKRDDDGDDDDDRSSSASSSSPGPQLPSGPHPASSPENVAGKRRRVVAGPAPPPAPLDEMPATAPNGDDEGESDESSDSDDGFGPALPTAADVSRANATKNDDDEWSAVRPQGDEGKEKKAQRDEWMMVPPKQDDLAARLDPTKLRARGFQTGKGARAPNHGGGGGLGMWLETPEQKRKRLENEVMGKGGGASSAGGERDARRKKDEETAKRLRRHEKRKGESLYEKHREKVGEKEDDDPSKRAFDYQKDMASGMRIDGTKRKEMIRKAGDFSSKFSGGSYL